MRQHFSANRNGVPLEAALPRGQKPRYRRLAAVALVGIAMVTGCATEGEQPVHLAAPVDMEAFEKYRDSARLVIVDGEPIYNVEFDLYFTEEQLLEYYATGLKAPEAELVDKSVVIHQVSTDSDLTFQRGEDALTITYCVSTGFGSNQAQAIQDMRDATADWQLFANFRFEYVAAQNGNCVGGVAGIDVAVIPSISSSSACATPPYFPSSEQGGWCSGYTQGTLGFDYANWPWSGLGAGATSRGVMRHELGHILGLRHEHAFSPDPGSVVPCGEVPTNGDIGGRQLTEYDLSSVMHYPQCGNDIWTFAVSDMDAEGVRQLYGMPAAWYPAILQPLAL